MEFTLDKLAKECAEKALDNYTYEGKTIREWVEILAKQQICGDCISREEAIKIVLPYTDGDLIADDIKKLPPVISKGVTVTDFADRCHECGTEYEKMLEEAKPKPGRWILCDILQEFKCSECRRCFRIKTNFCPNCGADMRVTRESKKNYISEEE